jgi:hypothetical protein
MIGVLQKTFWQNLVNVGLALLMLIPLMALALYNHASAADDYCHIDTVFKYGWLEAMNYYYTGWSGRYFSIFLNHSNPLIFHWFAGFKVIPFVLYLGVLSSFFFLIRIINTNKTFWFNMGMAGALFYLLILKLPSIVEAFFWTAAVVNYTVPNVLTLFWIVAAIKRNSPASRAEKYGMSLLMIFLVFAINGCSENNVFVILILIAGWFGYRLLFQKKLDGFYAFLLVWGIATALLSFLAPGNDVRLGGNPHSKDFMFALISSVRYTPHLLADWILSPALLAFSVLWAGVLPKVLKRTSGRSNQYFKIAPWYTLLVTAAIIVSQIFPSYYGIGVEPTPRVTNCIYFFFLLGWFYNIGVIMGYLSRKKYLDLNSIPLLPLAVRAGLVVLICVNFYTAGNSRLMYREWLSGDAAAYDKEMTERTRILMTSKEDIIYLSPLKYKPQTLFLEDITTNPQHLWNRCEAGYYNKKVVYLK